MKTGSQPDDSADYW